MPEPKGDLNFEADVLPHVNAAYNLARWLTRNRQDAEDVVQESFMRAFRFFGGCRGVNTRAWLLGIVRNTCYTWLLSNRRQQPTIEFDESLFHPDHTAPNPEQALLQDRSRKLIGLALEGLPPKFREVLILRELEEMSYREISEVMAIPAGTVMSRLSRARGELRRSLSKLAHGGHWSNPMGPSDQTQYCGEHVSS